MTDLYKLPALARTIVYYVLALAYAVIVPLIAKGVVDATWGSIILGVSGVFGFTLAGGNVSKDAATSVLADDAGE